MSVPTAPVVAASLVGGYAVARFTKIRPLGGAVLAVGGFVAQREWTKRAGPVNAAILERGVLRRVRRVAPVGEEDRPVARGPHRRRGQRSCRLGALRPPYLTPRAAYRTCGTGEAHVADDDTPGG